MGQRPRRRSSVSHGLRGATIIELLLYPAAEGRGHGAHLSVLLARELPLPDDQILFGTIHADNLPAYRAAIRAGRVDVETRCSSQSRPDREAASTVVPATPFSSTRTDAVRCAAKISRAIPALRHDAW